MEELHLFIIWENALYQKDTILADIEASFEVVKKYKITWSAEKFSENLSRFYGTNLPKNCGKEQHCGTGPFLLIVVKDKNPKYEKRVSKSHGEKVVNINTFDKKEYYRELTGGGHRIHCTEDETETNHDITLLLHMNIKDFLANVKPSDEIEELSQDLIGANGWKNAEEMFYALNNCSNYAILRNYENLPEEIYVNDHNDIDLICESKENCAYILNAKKVFPEEYRVHYVTTVDNKQAFFDLRFVGDKYYCREIEQRLLDTRKWNDKGFYTINDELYFYTLLYHAILHKPKFAEDYEKRLIKMGVEKSTNWTRILAYWLVSNGYPVEVPEDKSVLFNEENAKKIEEEQMNKGVQEYEDLLEENKSNILDWYPFEEGASVLKNSDEEGLFDYVVCFDKLSNLDKLKENGKVLLIVDNKLSVKSMCQSTNNEETYTKDETEKMLDDKGFKFKKFYYVFPDYKNANVIVTDEYMPAKEVASRNITFYKPADDVVCPEAEKIKDLISQDKDLLKIFANSFFIEASRQEFADNGIKFVSFSNMRKREYKIKTIFKGDKFYKTFANEDAKPHIEQIRKNIDILNSRGLKTIDTYEENTIISEYQDCETFDNTLTSKPLNEKIELVNKFYHNLKDKLCTEITGQNVFEKYNIKYEKGDIENLSFAKDGLWDLIFQNAFYKDGEFFFYDQEWYEENIPIEYIIYRAIFYCPELNGIKELYEAVGITEANMKLFAKLDNVLQVKTRDEKSWNTHAKKQLITEEVEQLRQDKKTITDECITLLNQKDARIKFLEDNMEATCKMLAEAERQASERQAVIDMMQNSRSWKITKPLRWVKRKGKSIE